jgi:hypothetical protein
VAETTRKKRGPRQAVIIDLPESTGGSTAETLTETPPATAADEQITNALESEAQGAEAMIYRADPSTGKEAFLDRVSAEMVTHDWIGKEYGGGKYRVQFRKPGPNGGAFVYGGQKRFEVDPNIPPKAPRWARVQASGSVSNADGTPAGSRADDVVSAGILAMINQMQDNSRAQSDFFRTVLADTSRKGPDFLEIVKAATPLIAPLLAMITQKREEKDPLDVALKLLELRGEQNKGGAAPTDVMKTVKDVLEIREMFSGSGGGEGPDPMIKLIETVAPQLIDTFKQAMALDAARAGQPIPTQGAAPTPAPVPRVAPPAPTTEPLTIVTGAEGTSQPPSGEASVEAWKMLVGSRIPKILRLAELGKNPVLYAQLEEDIIPEIFKPAAREFVEEENFTDRIYAEYPALLQHKEWMDEFFDVFAAALLGELDDDGGEDEEIETEIEVTDSEIPPVSSNGSQ